MYQVINKFFMSLSCCRKNGRTKAKKHPQSNKNSNKKRKLSFSSTSESSSDETNGNSSYGQRNSSRSRSKHKCQKTVNVVDSHKISRSKLVKKHYGSSQLSKINIKYKEAVTIKDQLTRKVQQSKWHPSKVKYA